MSPGGHVLRVRPRDQRATRVEPPQPPADQSAVDDNHLGAGEGKAGFRRDPRGRRRLGRRAPDVVDRFCHRRTKSTSQGRTSIRFPCPRALSNCAVML